MTTIGPNTAHAINASQTARRHIAFVERTRRTEMAAMRAVKTARDVNTAMTIGTQGPLIGSVGHQIR